MKLVILTGAGMSAESGIKTFRDSDGLWENYRIEDVCTPEALERNPELVNHFYNERRKQLYEAQPNAGHKGLAGLENYFDVRIITQNIDDLHERAGSKHVLHLHGELKKVRSSKNPDSIYDLKGWELKPGTRCEDGSLLRSFLRRSSTQYRTGNRSGSSGRYFRHYRYFTGRLSGSQSVALCPRRYSGLRYRS